MSALKPGDWIVNNYRGKDIYYRPKQFLALLENHDEEDILIILRSGKYINACVEWFDFCLSEKLGDDVVNYKYCPKELHSQEVQKYHDRHPTMAQLEAQNLQKAIPELGLF